MSTGILAPEKMDETDSAGTAASIALTFDENAGGFGEWFRRLQRESWENFQSLPMPKRTDEAWRFATIKSLDLSPYTKAEPLCDADQAALIKRSAGLEKTAGRMIFANDQILQREEIS